jgi:hypothetical protein
MKTKNVKRKKNCCRGHLAVVGAVLIQLAVGAHHGTFGNMLPYFTSFMRQVMSLPKFCCGLLNRDLKFYVDFLKYI